MRPVLVALALAACKGPVDLSAGPPVLEWSDELLDFGTVPIGDSLERSFTLTNTGGGQIGLLTLSLADGDPRLWSLDWDRVPLGPGDSLDVFVSFAPRDEGRPIGGRVQVRTDLAATPAVFVRVTGEGAPSNADDDGDGFTVAEGDCDDDDAQRYPGAPERCNGLDDDCDGQVPANEADADGDGVRVCQGDCDDTNGTVYPGAPELCDGLDNDCDNIVQDQADGDGDGFTVCDGDCDDTRISVNPGQLEVCGDGLDNDCDGAVDWIDVDADGHNLCGPDGDCDDADPLAFPRVVASTGAAGAVGSAAEPLASVAEALSTLDAVCRTVYVRAGTFTLTDATWSAGQVAIVGRGASAADVVLDAGGAGRHIDLTGGTLELRALTLSGGVAPAGQGGGAVRIAPGAQLTAVGVGFDGNSTDAAGGAVRVAGTLAISAGARFTGNDAVDGGAVAVVGGSMLDPGLSEYVGNTATGAGGAIHADGTLVQAGALYDGNAALHGGALALVGGSHTVQRGRFWSNTASGDGGAAWIGGAAGGLFRNHFVQDNAAVNGGGLWLGEAATASVWNNTFAANEASGDGAMAWVGADGASFVSNLGHFHAGSSGLHAPTDSLVTATHNTVFATSSGVDFSGRLAAGTDDNLAENASFETFTDNGDPSDDDLTLRPNSPAIDTGPAGSLDPDGTPNDRGATGGPGAL